MRLIPSFKPSVSYSELHALLGRCVSPHRGPPDAAEFLRAFGDYLPVRYVLPFPSARWGLYALLSGMDLQEGDEVLVPAFTYFAVPAAVVAAGLKPVFVDVVPGSVLIDAGDAERCVTPRTRVIIPTHLNGFACDMGALMALAGKYHLKVIEDCAQSPGASLDGKKLGTFGDAAYFTFGITKSFTTLGGGVVVTDDEDIARNAARISGGILPQPAHLLFAGVLKAYLMKAATSFLFPPVYAVERACRRAGVDIIDRLFRERETIAREIPRHGSLTGAQGSLGITQLRMLDRANEIRKRNGMALYRSLRTADGVMVPRVTETAGNTFSGCPVFVEHRDAVRGYLLAAGIDVSAGYMQDCSSLEVFRDYHRSCPHAARAASTILHLPSYPELSENELAYVGDMVRAAVRRPGAV